MNSTTLPEKGIPRDLLRSSKKINIIKYKYTLEPDPIGPVELNGIKYVPADYLERLEAAYLEEVAFRFETDIGKDAAREIACESLERIKRGEQG